MNDTIIRNLNQEEKSSGMIDLTSKDPTKYFYDLVAKKELQCVIDKVPFCPRCVRFDYADKIKKLETEIKRGNIHVSPTFNITEKELNTYGLVNFDYTDLKEIVTKRIVEGVAEEYVSGFELIFICKKRNCKHSITVPINRSDEINKKLGLKDARLQNKENK